MKKFLKIMTAAAVLLCGMVLTSCGLKEVVADSYNTWYKYKSDKEIDIPLIADSATDDDNAQESDQKLKNAEIYLYFDPDAGLTVSVQSKTTQTASFFNGLYSQTVTTYIGGNKQYTAEEFGSGKWTVLWTSGKIEKSSEPKIHSNPNECIDLSGTKQNGAKIQWKKFLANYLLKSFLGE